MRAHYDLQKQGGMVGAYKPGLRLNGDSMNKSDICANMDTLANRALDAEALKIVKEPRFQCPRPSIVDIANLSCGKCRSFPSDRDKRHQYLVGRPYWRFLSYVQGLWPSLEGLDRVPNLLMTGIGGCGKSWTMTAAATFLRQRLFSKSYRVLMVSDCAEWLDAPNPVSHFVLELLYGLHHGDRDEELEMFKGRRITQIDQLQSWLGAIDNWLAKHNLRLLIFLDQVEELFKRPDAVPNAIVQAVLEMRQSFCAVAVTVGGPGECSAMTGQRFFGLGFYHMRFPSHVPIEHYLFISDMLLNTPLRGLDMAFLRDVRLYTGSVFSEIISCLGNNPEAIDHDQHFSKSSANIKRVSKAAPAMALATRLEAYRVATRQRIIDLMECIINKLDRMQKVAVLLLLFRMVLRLPMDAGTSPINLPVELRNLFIPAALLRFYHPRDGIVVICNIPVAVSFTAHNALSSDQVFKMLTDAPLMLMHKLITSVMDSKTICAESKRRMIRHYTHFRLEHGTIMHFSGITDNDKPLKFELCKSQNVHFFPGLTPPREWVEWAIFKDMRAIERRRKALGEGKDGPAAKATDTTPPDFSSILIPARTDYCFFDFFVINYAERKIFAVTTSIGPLDWQKNTCHQPYTHFPDERHRSGTVTPTAIFDMVGDALKSLAAGKFTKHCIYIKPIDMLTIAGCPWKSADQATTGTE